MKEIFYCYITTNLINKKQYVGDRTCVCVPEDDDYLGSGTYFNNAKKKYGKENFKKEILKFFNTKQEAFDAQEKYIILYNTLIPNGYNISPKGGYGVPDSYLHEETKKKIGKAHKGKINLIFTKFNFEFKSGKSYEEQMINKYGEEEGLKRSEEYKNKISKNTKGENNPMYGKGYLISGDKNGRYGKPSSQKGTKIPLERRIKISNSKKGIKRHTHICPYCNRNISDGNFQRWHGENCKQKIENYGKN
jgi:hypothetical protein